MRLWGCGEDGSPTGLWDWGEDDRLVDSWTVMRQIAGWWGSGTGSWCWRDCSDENVGLIEKKMSFQSVVKLCDIFPQISQVAHLSEFFWNGHIKLQLWIEMVLIPCEDEFALYALHSLLLSYPSLARCFRHCSLPRSPLLASSSSLSLSCMVLCPSLHIISLIKNIKLTNFTLTVFIFTQPHSLQHLFPVSWSHCTSILSRLHSTADCIQMRFIVYYF